MDKKRKEIELRFFTSRSPEPAYLYSGSTETEEYKALKALGLPALLINEAPLTYHLFVVDDTELAKIFHILKVFPKNNYLKNKVLQEIRKKNMLP